MASDRTPTTRLAGALALAALVVTPVARAEERLVDRVAVVVNDDVIALSELYAFAAEAIASECLPPAVDLCRREYLGDAADVLVRRSLQRAELKRLGEDITPEEVDRTIAWVAQNSGYADRNELREDVESGGKDWDTYLRFEIEDFARQEKFNQLVLRSRVSISDEELRDQYQRLVRELGSVEVLLLEGFGLPVPADAAGKVAVIAEVRAALADVRAGRRTWAEVAAAYDVAKVGSLLHGNAIRPDELVPEMAAALTGIEPGGVAEPVIYNNLVWGLTLVGKDRQAIDVPPFEAVKDQLSEKVFQDRIEDAGAEWYATARRRAAVRYLVDVPLPDAK